MALLTSELARIKFELGVHLVGIGAVPHFEVYSVFEQVIGPYVTAGASTTSSTSVSASDPAAYAPETLTLDDATDFNEGDVVVIDVDSRQEAATIQTLSGSDITVLLKLDHTGTYPVTVEGGESIIREVLRHLRVAADKQAADGSKFGGLKKVDEIEFFGAKDGNRLSTLEAERMRLRDELSAAVGFPNLWRRRGGASTGISLY